MKKLIILGCYLDTNWDKINWIDDDIEIWTVAPSLYLYPDKIQRIDKLFEIHRKDEYLQDTYELIYNTELPVYMQKKDKKVKNCLIFPYEKLFSTYGQYFTNSISLMLAFGVTEGYKDIEICGVEMESNRESLIERPNLEYWIGKFQGQGISIKVDEECKLLKSIHVYGIDNILKHIDKVEKKINQLRKRKETNLVNICLLDETKMKKKDYYKKVKQLNEKNQDYASAIEGLEWVLREI